ncbi:MAG TPA: YjcZ family sporulation protein [Bacillales bacterium]|nr:YjcZ family sporulation protein [Bacillales bacterium]
MLPMGWCGGFSGGFILLVVLFVLLVIVGVSWPWFSGGGGW